VNQTPIHVLFFIFLVTFTLELERWWLTAQPLPREPNFSNRLLLTKHVTPTQKI